MPAPAELARALHGLIEPIHVTLYLCPEPQREFEALGLEPRGQGYVAGRSAPLGAVGPDEAARIFFNFNPALFTYALPAAWEIASPERVLDARIRGVRKVFARVGAPAQTAPEATELAVEAASDLDLSDRPLAEANTGVALTDDPLEALWQALTVLREHRGDGHVALLREGEIQPVEALVLYSAWQSVVSQRFLQTSRMWDDEAWQQAQESLAARGWLNADGQLTEEGVARRDQLEVDTDVRAAAPYDALGEAKSLALFDALLPIAVSMNEGEAFKRQVAIPDRPA